MVKNLPANAGDMRCGFFSLSWEDPLEGGLGNPLSILAEGIQWTEEPVRLQSIGLQRVGHD